MKNKLLQIITEINKIRFNIPRGTKKKHINEGEKKTSKPHYFLFLFVFFAGFFSACAPKAA
jgi:hypothetical protein